MEDRGEGWQAAAIELPPGEYGYLVVEDGVGRIDEYNPLTTFRTLSQVDIEVSRAEIADCEDPAVEIDEALVEGDTLTIRGHFFTGQDGDPLDVASITAAGLEVLPEDSAADSGALALRSAGLERGRHRFVVEARDASGRAAEAAVSVFVDPIAPRWQDAVLYQVVTDRFRGPGGTWLDDPVNTAARAGGTLDGVQASIEDGSLEALGVSAIWLSPVYQNPDVAREGSDGRLYESYHGYWVLDSRTVDPRIGGEQALRALIEAAHARGIAVILDLVPNHVYEDHPIVAAKASEGWFNEHPQSCVCGTASCPWDQYIQTCWFASYLPDLRLENPATMNFMVEELRWWVEEFDVDGVRVDAVPMMPRAASRRIADALRQASFPGDDRLLLGEIFVGGGRQGVQALRYYLGPQGLDSVFDFPTMWAIRDALASEAAGFTALDALLAQTDAELEGSGAVLGRMLGNHDTSRFISAVVGDGDGDPWDAPASQPEEGEALERVALALTLQLTLPGMPVLYYGDELGLAGAGDPDCRRVMPDPDSLSPARQALLAHARRLGRLRRELPALRSSLRETLHVGEDSYAYARIAEGGDGNSNSNGSGSSNGEVVVVALSRASDPVELALPGGVVPPGRYVDALGEAIIVDVSEAGASLELGPRSAVVLVRE
nr:alpha-amylase family glycosyl hydrolase [Pseudenhygromyxa sp. WMMC2535]